MQHIQSLTDADAAALRGAECPHGLFARLNAGPGIYRDPTTGNFVVTRYELVRRIATDTAAFSSQTGLTIERDTPIKARVAEMYATRAWPPKHVLLTNDPPEHRLYRALVDKVWSPARVTSLNAYMTDLVERSIDGFIDDGVVEFIAGFAATFPVLIAIDFLGLPRTDAAQVLEWTHSAVSIIDTRFDEAAELAAHEKIITMLNYIADAGRAAPADGDSFLSALKRVEIDGRGLTEQEFVWLVEILLVGGHDSVTLALGSGMIELIEQPGLADSLRGDPRRIDGFVEELLRTRNPVKALFRRTTADVTIEGVTIPRDAIVQLQWSGANLDPARFEDPDRFDPDRENAKRHVAFGTGIHMCIGNQLARAELRIAFASLLGRMRNFRFAEGRESVRFRTDYVQQGPIHLPIAFERV